MANHMLTGSYYIFKDSWNVLLYSRLGWFRWLKMVQSIMPSLILILRFMKI